ncbi:MAG: ATP-binding cassette domain-containing protein [Bryobacteraceae bacterium]|nr:ATP-binding cassette domain-containing protein [Bryobacteraceae bacterium]
MIEVENLSRHFTDKKRGVVKAVDEVSFRVKPGEIFGLLGPNGAGKSTTLRIIATLLAPTSGVAKLAGYDVTREPERVRRMIGFLSGDMALYARMTPRELMYFYGRLCDVNEADLKKRSEEMIETLGMRDFADTRIDKLSSGMKQKAGIARTLIHNPPVLIFDEPTATLDVPTSRIVEAFVLEAKRQGKCIVYSTHIMEEAEYLCDRIAVINEGRIKMTGTMEELRAATGKQRLREIFLELLDWRAA